MHYSEDELISELKKRNPIAFEVLMQEYTKPVYYLTYHILTIGNSKEDIEECVSDVFLEVWQKINRFDAERGSFKTWILILTKYRALAYKRRNEKHPTVSLEDCQLEDPADVERQVVKRETQERILQAIKAFNDVDRQLFIRRYFLGEEISNLMSSMKLSRSAIDNRLMRGRNRIKEALSDE